MYALKTKNYKQAAELIIAVRAIAGRVENSEFLKKELFDKLSAQELGNLPSNEKSALADALVSISEKVNNEFYANDVIKSMAKKTESPKAAEEVPQEVPA